MKHETAFCRPVARYDPKIIIASHRGLMAQGWLKKLDCGLHPHAQALPFCQFNTAPRLADIVIVDQSKTGIRILQKSATAKNHCMIMASGGELNVIEKALQIRVGEIIPYPFFADVFNSRIRRILRKKLFKLHLRQTHDLGYLQNYLTGTGQGGQIKHGDHPMIHIKLNLHKMDPQNRGYLVQKVDQIIGRHLRHHDLIARVHDAEFIIVLQNSPADAMQNIANRLYAHITQDNFFISLGGGAIDFDISLTKQSFSPLPQKPHKRVGSPLPLFGAGKYGMQ